MERMHIKRLSSISGVLFVPTHNISTKSTVGSLGAFGVNSGVSETNKYGPLVEKKVAVEFC